MQTITTTELRTKSKDLIITLLSGRSVNLIHRSQIIAELKPRKEALKLFTAKDAEEIIKISEGMNLPKLSDEEMNQAYHQEMTKKHGQGLS